MRLPDRRHLVLSLVLGVVCAACATQQIDSANRLGKRTPGTCYAVATSAISGQFAAYCDSVVRQHFSSWDYDETIEIIGADDGALRERFVLRRIEKGDLWSKKAEVEYSPDGRMLAVISRSGRFDMLDATTGSVKPRGLGDEPDGNALALAFSTNGARLAVSYVDAERMWLDVFDATDLQSALRIPLESGWLPDPVALSPDGELAALPASTDGGYAVWLVDTASGDVVTTIDVQRPPHGLLFSPEGERLFVLADELTVYDLASCCELAVLLATPGIWAATQSESAEPTLFGRAPRPRMKFSPDGRRLAVADYLNRINLFGSDTLEPLGVARLPGATDDNLPSLAATGAWFHLLAPYPADIAWLADGERLAGAFPTDGLRVVTLE